MTYFIYILYSKKLDSFYKGQTSDLEKRIRRHNSGSEKSTKNGVPWEVIWTTVKNNRSSAMILERKLKNLSRRELLKFISRYQDGSQALTP